MARSGSTFVVLGLGAAVMVGAGGVVAWRVMRNGRAHAAGDTTRYFVAFDADRALQYGGGIGSPFVVRGVSRQGNVLHERSRWNGGEGLGVHPWQWALRGHIALGETHSTSTAGSARLLIYHFARGHVATVDGLERGAFGFADDHTVVFATPGTVHLLDTATAPSGTPWHATVPVSRFAVFVSATPRHVVTWNGELHSYDRDASAARHAIGPIADIVGVATERDEALVLRDGRIVAVSLSDGTSRLTLDVAAGAGVVDGLDDPCLLGRHAGRWVFVYATALDHVTTPSGQPSWTRYAPRTLAAVDPVTGAVAWRLPIGEISVSCTENTFRSELPSDHELPSTLMVHGYADVADGRELHGTIVALDAATGVLRWRAEYAHADRGSNYFARRGDVVYARLGAVDHDGILRFEAGRLAGAVRVAGSWTVATAPAVVSGGVWVGSPGWMFLGAPDLRVAAAEGDRGRATESRAWAIARYALPPEAL